MTGGVKVGTQSQTHMDGRSPFWWSECEAHGTLEEEQWGLSGKGSESVERWVLSIAGES